MSEAPKRRWFRFSLRGLLVVVTVFCIWLAWNVRIVHQRARARHAIEASGGTFIENDAAIPGQRAVFQRPPHGDSVDYSYQVSWVRWMLGDEPARVIFFDGRGPTDQELEQTAYFPEALVCTH